MNDLWMEIAAVIISCGFGFMLGKLFAEHVILKELKKIVKQCNDGEQLLLELRKFTEDRR